MTKKLWGKSFVSVSLICILALLMAVVVPVAGAASPRTDTSGFNPAFTAPGDWHAMAALDESHVWAVGGEGGIKFYNGSQWIKQVAPESVFGDLWGVFATNATNAWIVGDLGLVLRTSDGGATWYKNPPAQTSTTSNFFGVFAPDSNHVWAVGESFAPGEMETGLIMFWNGTQWTRQPSNAPSVGISSIWGSAANNVWAVGGLGTILHWNGSVWSQVQPGLTNQHLLGVFGLDASHVWAVGDGGTILFYNGTTWVKQTSGTTQALRTGQAMNAISAWVVGEGGTALYWDGTSWASRNSGVNNILVGVQSLGENSARALRESGEWTTIGGQIGETLSLLTPNGGETLNAGSTYNITWSKLDSVTTVKIKVSYNGGATWNPVAANVTGTSYAWTVPSPLGNQTNVQIKIAGIENGVVVATDKSDAPFAIQVLKLNSPNGGEILNAGSTHNITWSTYTDRPVGKVKIQVKQGPAAPWVLVEKITGNPGTYTWTVPNTAKQQVKVRVTLIGPDGIVVGQDKSDNWFSIQ